MEPWEASVLEIGNILCSLDSNASTYKTKGYLHVAQCGKDFWLVTLTLSGKQFVHKVIFVEGQLCIIIYLFPVNG